MQEFICKKCGAVRKFLTVDSDVVECVACSGTAYRVGYVEGQDKAKPFSNRVRNVAQLLSPKARAEREAEKDKA